MNIYIVLGAALTSREIRRLLFQDPQLAADQLGVVLSNGEVKILKAITKRGDGTLQQQFRMLAKIVCPEKPCLLAPVTVRDKDCRESDDAKTDDDPDAQESASMTSAAD